MRKFLCWFKFSRAVLPLAVCAAVGVGNPTLSLAQSTWANVSGNAGTPTGTGGSVNRSAATEYIHESGDALIQGGAGGNANSSTTTHGGKGGDASLQQDGGQANPLTIRVDGKYDIFGGNGGNHDNTYNGGNGGSATLITHTLSTGGIITVKAGNHGDASGVNDGHGANASLYTHLLTAHSAVNITGSNDATATSLLHVSDTMIAREINVYRTSGGLVDVMISRLDMAGKSTTITSTGYTVAQGTDGPFNNGTGRVITDNDNYYGYRKDFYIVDANLSGGAELIIEDTGGFLANGSGLPGDGTLEIDTLDVSGLGYLQTTSREVQSITNMHVLENGVVSYMLPEQYRDGTADMADYTTQLVTVGNLELGSNGNNFYPNTYMTIDTRPDMNGVRPHLGPGDEQHLISSVNPITGLDRLNPSSWTESGHRLDVYAWDDTNGYAATNDIWARVSTTPMVSLSHARLASLAFANWGGDLISGAGMRAATAYNLCPPCPTRGHCIGPDGKKLPCCIRYERCAVVPFVVGQGGSSEYKTGQAMDIDGGTVMGGVAWNKFCCNERLFTVGIFGEGGWGNYNVRDQYLNPMDITSERTAYGKGDTNYYGGGLLARYGWNCNPLCGFFVEGSLRIGKIDADYDSTTLAVDNSWTHVDFDGMYYGAHVGAGYGWSWKRDLFFELSTKFLWTHYEGEDENIRFAQTHRQSFDDMDSYRARVGARLNKVINPCFMPYVGAGWEYEFDGKSTSTYTTEISGRTFAMDSRDLRGGTGMGEIGAMLQPCSNRNFIIDLSGQGYWGVRQGGVAVLALKWVY